MELVAILDPHHCLEHLEQLFVTSNHGSSVRGYEYLYVIHRETHEIVRLATIHEVYAIGIELCGVRGQVAFNNRFLEKVDSKINVSTRAQLGKGDFSSDPL